MTRHGKTQLLYTEEMKMIDGKVIPEKTRQQEMSKDRGKILKREMYKINRYWTLDNYKAVRMLSNETRGLQKRKSVTKNANTRRSQKNIGKSGTYTPDT